MKPLVWFLLILSSTLYAQTASFPGPLVPNNQSQLPMVGESVSIRELLLPSKAVKELRRS
jgi:hypothetical protein